MAMNIRNIYRGTFVVAFLYASAYAVAATTTTPQAPDASTTVQVLTAVINTIDSALKGMTNNGAINGLGDTITYSLVAIVISWTLLRSLVEGGGVTGVVAELVPVLASTAVVMALLTAGGIGDIVDSMDRVSSALTGSPVSDLKSLLELGVRRGLMSIYNVMSMPSPFPPIDGISAAIQYGAWWVIFGVTKLVTSIIVAVAVALYIGNITLAFFAVFLAIALAPLLVPFLIAPATQWIFDGWLRFIVSASLTKLVSVFILSFTSKLMEGLESLSKIVEVKPTDDGMSVVSTVLFICVGMILIACLCAYLQIEGPKLAQGLLSGGGMPGFKAKPGKMLGDIGGVNVAPQKTVPSSAPSAPPSSSPSQSSGRTASPSPGSPPGGSHVKFP